jgi:hypothetical protein
VHLREVYSPKLVEEASLLKKSALSWLRPQMKLETPKKWRIGARSGMKACTEGVFQQADAFCELRLYRVLGRSREVGYSIDKVVWHHTNLGNRTKTHEMCVEDGNLEIKA